MPTVTVASEDFSRAIAAAKNVVAGRTTMPIFECVLISARDGVMRVAATSADHAVETDIPAQGDGSWVLSHARLAAFTGAIQRGKPVTITGDGLASLRCGSVAARISSLSPQDFPAFSEMPAFSANPTWQGASFPSILSRIAMCCEDRPGMLAARAIHIKINGTSGRAYGLNGFMLARQDFTTDAPADVALSIDMTSAPVIASLFEKGPVWVAQHGRTLWMKGGGTIYHAKTVDCEPPDQFGALEYVPGETISADMEGVTRALKAVQSMAAGKERAVVFNVSQEGSFIGANDGASALCVPFDADGAGHVSSKFNGDVLRRVLSAYGGETVQFGWRDKLSTGASTPSLTFTGAGFFGLIMPLKTNASEIEDVLSAWRVSPEREAA